MHRARSAPRRRATTRPPSCRSRSAVCARARPTSGRPGLLSQLRLLDGPCFEDNRINDASATLFETPPATRTLPILGPINAHLNVSSNTGDGLLSVALSDVAPDGSVKRLTGGWQVISLRELDEARSRHLDGQVVQPFHPFTKASVDPAAPGQVVPVDVEVFPTGAAIQPGHRLRLSVQAFDVPHLAPTLPELLGVLTTLTVHSSPDQPSTLVLPTRDRPAPPSAGQPSTGQPSAVPAVASPPAAVPARPTLRLRVSGRRLVVRLSAAAGGRLRVRLDGRAVGSQRPRAGRATFRLPHVGRGRHTVRVAYVSGGRVVARAAAVWRVR